MSRSTDACVRCIQGSRFIRTLDADMENAGGGQRVDRGELFVRESPGDSTVRNQRSKQAPFAIYTPSEFFDRRSGVCVDLARFAVETLKQIAIRIAILNIC